MARYRSASWGEVNGAFGMLLDNLASLVLFFSIVTNVSLQYRFDGQFVLERMIPGTVAGVLVGSVIYTVLAFRLARRTGRSSVTAMPVGLDTPTVIAMALLVLLPSLQEAEKSGMDRHTASAFAWHVGIVTTILLGLFKTVCAPFGNLVRSWLPRAGMLGSLAAISLALIAFLPLWREVAAVPLVGMPTLAVVLVTIMAGWSARGRIPGALLAVLVGFGIFVATFTLGRFIHQPLVPTTNLLLFEHSGQELPQRIWEQEWWWAVWDAALAKLLIVLPLGLATLVGGVEAAESASAAGDEYSCGSILLTQGLATTAAGLCGGVVQNTPYFGHPAYKQMGARFYYVLIAGLLFALLGYTGWFVRALEYLPPSVLFPIIVYIGLQTIAHSFAATPSRDYAAMALAGLPVLAYVMILVLNEVPLDPAWAMKPPITGAKVLVQTLRCLSNGFIVTSLLWGSSLAWLLNGRPVKASLLLLVAAACSLVGIIHSPLFEAPLAWPWDVMVQLSPDARIQCQTPYHWAAAYLLTALIVLVSALLPVKNEAAGQVSEGNPEVTAVSLAQAKIEA